MRNAELKSKPEFPVPHLKHGSVLWFNDISGMGRIRSDDGASVIVSHKSLSRDGYKILDEGQRVSFETVLCKSGLEARKVKEEGGSI